MTPDRGFPYTAEILPFVFEPDGPSTTTTNSSRIISPAAWMGHRPGTIGAWEEAPFNFTRDYEGNSLLERFGRLTKCGKTLPGKPTDPRFPSTFTQRDFPINQILDCISSVAVPARSLLRAPTEGHHPNFPGS